MDFANGFVNSVLDLSEKFFREFKIQKSCIKSMFIRFFFLGWGGGEGG